MAFSHSLALSHTLSHSHFARDCERAVGVGSKPTRPDPNGFFTLSQSASTRGCERVREGARKPLGSGERV
eukprot:122285-Prorocentrum_minimum.AAC.1